jgi:hypothetical protein
MLIINFHELKFLGLLKYEQILIKILFLFIKRKLFNIILEEFARISIILKILIHEN